MCYKHENQFTVLLKNKLNIHKKKYFVASFFFEFIFLKKHPEKIEDIL